MGRPRKRQKTEDEPPASSRQQATSPRPIQPAAGRVSLEQNYNGNSIDPSLSQANDDRSQFENICNGPMARTVRTQRNSSMHDNQSPSLHSSTSDNSHSQNSIPTPAAFDPFGTSYPTDVANWPDFSTLKTLPLPVEDNWRGLEPDSVDPLDPDVNPDALSNLPPVPGCPCLPNLYLTLSTLSTLSSFPFTQQTIQTIESSYRTARGVIYCSVCPQKFDTGSSNLMLGSTLLTVLADQWHRFRKLGVDEIRKSFGTSEQQQSFITTKEGMQWRHFAHQVIRAYAFGDAPIPTPPGSTCPPAMNSSVTNGIDDGSNNKYAPLSLMGLCDSLTRRQRQWHHLEEVTDEFPDRLAPDLAAGHLVGETKNQAGHYLCIEIANRARCLVDRLEGPTPCH